MKTALEMKSNALATVITIRWNNCTKSRDWNALQHWLDGMWVAMAVMGAKEESDELSFLSDVAFEREYM